MLMDECGKRIRVLIADDNHDYAYLVEECLRSKGFEVVGKVYDGETVVKEIIDKKPDMVLLDVIMPRMSGISVLEYLQKNPIQPEPVIITVTAVGQEEYIKEALNLGAGYYILKPYNMALLPERIQRIYNDARKTGNGKEQKMNHPPRNSHKFKPVSPGNNTAEKAKEEVKKVLGDIGVPECLAGYKYLKKAILEIVMSDQGFLPVTKTLYPMIAAECNTTPGKVEREIRGAIQKVWQRINQQKLSKYFGRIEYYKGVRPTNSEFIATLADKIRLMHGIK